MSPRITPRAEWGARAPKTAPRRIAVPTPELWVHHTATEQHGPEGMRAIQAFHQDGRGWNDIAYSFCVDDDGTIYEGRGFGIQGGHTAGHNSISHAICFLGNLDLRPPTHEAVAAANWLFHEGVRRGQWRVLTGGHKQASGASTACPGRYGMAILPQITAGPVPVASTPEPEPEPPEDEMDYRVIYLTDNKTVAWLHNTLSGLTYRLGSLDEAKFFNGLGVPSVWVAESTVQNAIQAFAPR